MKPSDGFKGFSPIFGKLHAGGKIIHKLVVKRIDVDMAVVERTDIRPVHVHPRCSAVFGPVDSCAEFLHVSVFRIGFLLCTFPDCPPGLIAVLDYSHQDFWIAAGNSQAYPTEISRRQARFQFLPGYSSVRGFENTAVWPPGIKAPGLTQPLPEADVENVRILRVHNEVNSASLAVIRQSFGQLLPGLSTVLGLEQTAIPGIAPGVAGCGRINDIGVSRMSDDPADRLRGFKAHPGECFASVIGFIDTVAPGNAVSAAFLTCSHPDDIRILLEERHIADRRGAVFVKNRLPGRPGVHRFPDSSGSSRHKHLSKVALQSFKIRNAANHVGWPDVAPLEVPDQVFFRTLGKERASHTQNKTEQE